MTETEQRIAIAEFCGWNVSPGAPITNGPWGYPANKPDWQFLHQLPDYLHDLNAINEAELRMDERQIQRFLPYLSAQTPKGKYITFAPADVRAKALLRAIGKWKD